MLSPLDALKEEIAKKRKALDNYEVVQDKMFKQGDLAKKQSEEYHRKQLESKKGLVEELETEKVKCKEDTEELLAPRDDVIRRLRLLKEPIFLFGESERDAFQRLRDWELKSATASGRKNDYRLALQQVDEEYMKEAFEKTNEEDGGDASKARAPQRKKESEFDSITIEQLIEEGEGLRKGDDNFDHAFIYKFLKYIFYLWDEELQARDPEFKRSAVGKHDSAVYGQTLSYMKPLFKRIKKRTLSYALKNSMADIVRHLLKRNYIKSYERYLEMAIGNAPWPIGAGMVGIHARPGREKSSEKLMAHVLNDETQRKFITALKRLMAHCQKQFPTEPHKSVNFDVHNQR